MNITEVTDEKKLTLSLNGVIDENSDILAKKLTETLDKDFDTVILNMENVDYISSFGLCVLVTAYKKSLKVHKKFLINKMSDRVREVLNVLGISKLLTNEEDYFS